MTRGQLIASIPLILAVSLAGCGSVTPVGPDGGSTGRAGSSGTGNAGTSGTAGTGSAGTTGAAGSGSAAGTSGAAGVGSAGTTGAAGSGKAGTSGAAGAGSAGTTGAAGTGHAGTGAAGTGAAGTGAAGTGGLRPCVDTMCQGACAGTSCDGPWTCDAMASCIEIAAQYCGCDGKTFTASGCSPRAFAHRGACEAGVSCDTSKILCKRLAPACPAGQVPSVEGTCYGQCVKIDACTCAGPADCPDPDHTTCHNNTKRCGPFVN